MSPDTIARGLKLTNQQFRRTKRSEIRRRVKCDLKTHLAPFYRFYFGECSERLKIPLETFYFRKEWPTQTKPADPESRRSTGQRRLNYDYLKLIFKSTKFVNDFMFYLNREFLNEYKGKSS